MSILLYCVAPKNASGVNAAGVAGARVVPMDYDGLRFFVSEVERQAMAAADVAESARAVHAVVMEVFARGPVLPFRYATVLEGEQELEKLADEKGGAFEEFLSWVGSRVQMDVKLSVGQQEQTEGPSTRTEVLARDDKGASGTEYLKQRARRNSTLRLATENCRRAWVSEDWRVEERDKIFICHALVERVQVISFQERMSRLELPDGVKGVVSGPWPPAGFWEEKSR